MKYNTEDFIKRNKAKKELQNRKMFTMDSKGRIVNYDNISQIIKRLKISQYDLALMIDATPDEKTAHLFKKAGVEFIGYNEYE